MAEAQIKPKVTINGVQSEVQSNQSLGRQVLEVFQIVADVILLILKILYAIGESIYRTIVPKEAKSVAGKVVLITGTGHGIGKELALLYASQGARVVGWDLNKESNDETIKEINERGYTKAHGYVCDVSNRKNVLEVAKKVQQEVGHVSVLINNAGIMPTHPLWDHTQEEIERIFKINVFAHYWTVEAFLPAMKEYNDGHIVALSSCAGLMGLENLTPYCGSKFAVRGMMEALHEDLRLCEKTDNIKITTVFPYMVDTGLCKKPRIRFENLMALLKPKDVAEAIMNAQRTNQLLVSVPGYFMYLNNITRLLPIQAAIYMKDFFDVGVESDL